MDRVTRNVTVTAASVSVRVVVIHHPARREGGKGKTRSVDFNEIPGKRNTAAKEENGRDDQRRGGKGTDDRLSGEFQVASHSLHSNMLLTFGPVTDR